MREETNNWLKQANKDFEVAEKNFKIAKKFASKIKKKFNVEKVILFGSRARGDNLRNSDFDFIVVSKDFEGKPFILRASDFYDHWDMEADIEALCYTPKEFERMKKRIGIVREAVREGVIVS